MARHECSVVIDRPVDEVFAYLADFTHVPAWNYFVTRVEQTTAGPVGVGTEFHQVRRDDEQTYRVTDYEPPRRVRVATLPGERPAFTRDLHLEPVGDGGTTIRDDWELDTGHPGVVQRLAARRVQGAVATNLAHLAELLETGRTRLPDGRVVTRPG